MSISRDDYVPSHGNQSTEPGDPSNLDNASRREISLAPSSVKIERLPKPLIEGDKPLTIEDSRKAYLRTQRASWTSEERTSKYERHKNHLYPRILGSDRHFRTEIEGLTTAMLTRRLSPLDEFDNWLTPWECNEMLHGGTIHRSVREALDYNLDEFSFEWVSVTAPTRSAGTPHEHTYLWIEDPGNDVTTQHLEPALEKHLKYCSNAYQKHHRFHAEGTGGAITIEQTPRIVNEAPDKISSVLKHSSPRPNTRGAQYLASQLAHLPLGDFYDGEQENPPDALFEGAALAWASPRNWFRSSQGVPTLEELSVG